MADLLSTRTEEVWAPGKSVLIWIPLCVVSGLFVGGYVHEFGLSDAAHWQLVIFGAWLLSAFVGFLIVLRAPRTARVSEASNKRKRSAKLCLPIFIAPAAVLTYLGLLVFGAANVPAVTDAWLRLTSPLVDAGHFVMPNVRTYSAELTRLGLEARKPLLCHAYVAAFFIQVVAWSVMLRAPVAWWRAMPNKSLTRWEKGRKLIKLGFALGLAFLTLLLCFGPGTGFDELDDAKRRGLDNFSHISDLYLVIYPTVESALASAALFGMPIFFVAGLRWLMLPSATGEDAQWRLADASVRTDPIWLGLCPKVDLSSRPVVVQSFSRSAFFGWMLFWALPGAGVVALLSVFKALWAIYFVLPFMFSLAIWNWRAVVSWRKQIICRFDWEHVRVTIKKWTRVDTHDIPYNECDCVLYYQKKALTFWRKFKPLQVFQVIMLQSTKREMLIPLYVSETEEPVREIAETYSATLKLPLRLQTSAGVRDASEIPANADLVGA